MNGLVFWIAGAVSGLIGLVCLFVASNTGSSTTYWAGLVLFAITVLVDFWLIKRWFDRIEAQEPAAEHRS